jgi:hypothetical protein
LTGTPVLARNPLVETVMPLGAISFAIIANLAEKDFCVMSSNNIYRIVFYNQGNVYEIYARKVEQSNMYAFIEVEDIIFGERSKLLIDPSEEKLKNEFSGVKRTHIPIQAVMRIDEVEQAGQNKIVSDADGSANITPFPISMPPGHKGDAS